MALSNYNPDEIHREDLGRAPVATAKPVKPSFDGLKSKMESLKVISNGSLDEKAVSALPAKDVRILQTELSKAGLYVPEQNEYYADGKVGPLTLHGLSIVANDKNATRQIAEEALRDKKLDKAEIMKLQVSLNRLGFDSGEVDGKFGRKTAAAVRDFLETNPEAAEKIDPAMKKMLTGMPEKGSASHLFNHKAKDAFESKKADLPVTTPEGKTLLHPDLVEKMQKHPMIKDYVQTTFKVAERHGLDGNMLANQFYQESMKLYNPNSRRYGDPAHIVSHAGAIGLAQIMPGTAQLYGVHSKTAMRGAELSADIGARYIKDMMKEYGVGQDVALVGYNAGPKRIEELQKWAGKRDVTVEDFIRKMEDEREEKGITFNKGPHKGQVNHNLVRVQTYDYVREIVPSQWDEKTLRRANDKPENQINKEPEKPRIGNSPAYAEDTTPLSRYTQSEIEIRTANKNDKLSASFSRAADLIQIADLPNNPAPTKPKGPEFSPQPFGG